MQLINIIDISEDNYKIVCDCFEADSVNVMKDRPLIAKKHRKFHYILAGSVYQKTMKIVIRNNNTQNVRKPYWFVTNS